MGTLFTPGIEQNQYEDIHSINLRVNNKFIGSFRCTEKQTIFDVIKVIFNKRNKSDVDVFCTI